jgi:hypothetical protein
LITEVEKLIDIYLQEIQISDKIDPSVVLKEEKAITGIRRSKQRTDMIEEEKKKLKQKKEQQEKKKKQFNFVKSGRPGMQRSTAPTVKRVKEVTKKLTDDEEDMQKYLGNLV